MGLELNEALLNKIITVLVVAVIVTGVVVGLVYSGVLDGISGSDNSQIIPGKNPLDSEDIEPVVYPVDYPWIYNGEHFSWNTEISNDTYERFHDLPDIRNKSQWYRYATVTGDRGLISDMAQRLLSISTERGWGDYDTVMNTVTLVRAIPLTQGAEGQNIPSYPVEMLADGRGSAGDHAVLAAALLKSMGYSVSLLSFNETYDRGTMIPAHLALGVRGDGSLDGWCYEVPSGELYYYIETTGDGPVPEELPAPYWKQDPEFILGDLGEGQMMMDTDEHIAPPLNVTLRCPGQYDNISEIPDSYPAKVLRIPTSDYTDQILEHTSQCGENINHEVSDYWENTWYPVGVSWRLNNKWRLNVEELTIEDGNETLSDVSGETYISPVSPWRIRYTVHSQDLPYSDVRFAVYKLDQNETPELYRTFGYHYLYGSEKEKEEAFYETGDFLVAVFVRNCDLHALIELHGKDPALMAMDSPEKQDSGRKPARRTRA